MNAYARHRSQRTSSSFLATPKSTVYSIKKRFDAEMTANGNVAKGDGEPTSARKTHKHRRDSLDEQNGNFVKELQRRINRDPGRPIRRLAEDMGVDEKTIRRYLKTDPSRQIPAI